MATPDATISTEREVRAGSMVLSVFENPLNARILRAHAEGPRRLADLRKKVGWSAQTTVRAAIDNLREIGALSKETVGSSGYGVATSLTSAGEEMLFVADVVESWLMRCPAGPISPENEESKGAVKALAGGWSSSLMRVLADGPITLSELGCQITDISYSALERRVTWMRTTGQLEAARGARRGRGTPLTVTDWLRRAVAPLSVAGRCERRHFEEERAPVTDVEVETSFLLGLPLVPLRPGARGSCALVAQTEAAAFDASGLAGVEVEVERGEIVSCSTTLGREPTTWAVATSEGWLDAVIDGRVEGLRLGGVNPQLALDLAAGLHFALFPDRSV